jgi:hypothetical protein
VLASWFLAELISSPIKMEAVCSSETSIDTQRTLYPRRWYSTERLLFAELVLSATTTARYCNSLTPHRYDLLHTQIYRRNCSLSPTVSITANTQT